MIDRHITAVLEDFREALEGILQGAGVIDEGLVLAGVNIIVELNPYLIPKGKRVRVSVGPKERKNERIDRLGWEALSDEGRRKIK